jgi:secondary thiamine-phosphate synthase enzyme
MEWCVKGAEMLRTFQVKTSSRTEWVDITRHVQEVVRESGVQEGICHIFVPHTTAAVTLNENADPDVPRDVVSALNKLIPFEDRYHHLEGNSAAHIKATLVGSSLAVIVDTGKLLLGTWQAIFFCEFDGPRDRKVHVKVVGRQRGESRGLG